MGHHGPFGASATECARNGLKENEVQRRYAKAYESSYMTEQLAKLVARQARWPKHVSLLMAQTSKEMHIL